MIKNPCGYKHYYPTTHSRDECHSNLKNAGKTDVKNILAKKKAKKVKRVLGSSSNSVKDEKLKTTIAAQKALLEVT